MAGNFQTTNWSLVLEAGSASSPEAGAALSRLCEAYWYPVYAFVRRQGHSPADAEDLTQGYFTRFLEKRYVKDADANRGRFRTFVRASVRNYLRNEYDHGRALKRGGGRPPLSLDTGSAEGRLEASTVRGLSPEETYDRAWAESVLAGALDRLEKSLEGTNRTRFPQLRAFLTGNEQSAPYAALAKAWGISEGAVRVAVHQLRRRFGTALREEISATVGRDEDVDDEIRYLLAVLGG